MRRCLISWVRTERMGIDFFKKTICPIVQDHSGSIRQHVDWKRSQIQVRVVADKTKQGAKPQSASSLMLTCWLESIHLWSFKSGIASNFLGVSRHLADIMDMMFSRLIELGWFIPGSRSTSYNVKGSPRNSAYERISHFWNQQTSYIDFEFPARPSLCPRQLEGLTLLKNLVCS